jgi:hypothetical protein
MLQQNHSTVVKKRHLSLLWDGCQVAGTGLGRVWDGLKVKKTQCLPGLGRVGRVKSKYK